MEDEVNEDNFPHYTPQHPLPEEIKKLARDDTVCKYCGVSYLIHNEIKALEDKLKEAEKELATLRGQEQREALLRQENDLLKQQKEELQSSVQSNTQLISSLNRELADSTEKSSKAEESAALYKNKYMTILKQFSALSQTVRQQKKNLQEIKTQLVNDQAQLAVNFQTVLKQVVLIKETSGRENCELESQLQCLDMEKLVLTQSNKALSDNVKDKEEELHQKERELESHRVTIAKLEENMQNADTLSESIKNNERILNGVKEELEISLNQCKVLTVELDQYKTQLRSKTSELNDMVGKQKQLEQGHEVAIQKLNLEVKAKENELGSCLKQLKTLENQCREFQRKENESLQQNKATFNETQELRDGLQRARADAEALKAERELMIEAHQNRIEDLRESFKNKMAETENWPQKLQAAVAAEKTRHLTEMRNLEENLKHNFVLELQIEKDKYNELLKKFQEQERGKNSERENQQALLEQKYRQEIVQLQCQVTDSKKRESEREEELTREINSLKKIINDLQDRLARLDGAETGKLSDLQNELRKNQQELSDAHNHADVLEKQLREVKQEAQFLQTVVHKECEERFELTEALSEARKELLQLKKPLGGYVSMAKRGSVSSIHSENPSNSNSPGPLAPTDDPLLKLRSPMATNNVNLSYQNGNNSRSSSSHSLSDRNNESQMLESRKRIANMMGRRS